MVILGKLKTHLQKQLCYFGLQRRMYKLKISVMFNSKEFGKDNQESAKWSKIKIQSVGIECKGKFLKPLPKSSRNNPDIREVSSPQTQAGQEQSFPNNYSNNLFNNSSNGGGSYFQNPVNKTERQRQIASNKKVQQTRIHRDPTIQQAKNILLNLKGSNPTDLDNSNSTGPPSPYFGGLPTPQDSKKREHSQFLANICQNAQQRLKHIHAAKQQQRLRESSNSQTKNNQAQLNNPKGTINSSLDKYAQNILGMPLKRPFNPMNPQLSQTSTNSHQLNRGSQQQNMPNNHNNTNNTTAPLNQTPTQNYVAANNQIPQPSALRQLLSQCYNKTTNHSAGQSTDLKPQFLNNYNIGNNPFIKNRQNQQAQNVIQPVPNLSQPIQPQQINILQVPPKTASQQSIQPSSFNNANRINPFQRQNPPANQPQQQQMQQFQQQQNQAVNYPQLLPVQQQQQYYSANQSPMPQQEQYIDKNPPRQELRQNQSFQMSQNYNFQNLNTQTNNLFSNKASNLQTNHTISTNPVNSSNNPNSYQNISNQTLIHPQSCQSQHIGLQSLPKFQGLNFSKQSQQQVLLHIQRVIAAMCGTKAIKPPETLQFSEQDEQKYLDPKLTTQDYLNQVQSQLNQAYKDVRELSEQFFVQLQLNENSRQLTRCFETLQKKIKKKSQIGKAMDQIQQKQDMIEEILGIIEDKIFGKRQENAVSKANCQYLVYLRQYLHQEADIIKLVKKDQQKKVEQEDQILSQLYTTISEIEKNIQQMNKQVDKYLSILDRFQRKRTRPNWNEFDD